MDRDWDDLFTVDEIMGGLPARRASALLFAVEGRTAQLIARSRRAMARDYTGRAAEQEEQAFLSALSEGANLPVAPTIQNLERYAPDWASLVPGEPSLRAALARQMGEKYRIPAESTHRLQRALAIDSPETTARFHELYGEPVSSIFAVELTWRERLRWLKSRLANRLDTLPPFWTAFALTLTETVGAGILALPIAYAALGVLGAVILLLVLGAVNVMTIAAMAEAVARNGNIRYGHAYFGRLVHDYLGRPGVAILTPALMVFNAVLLMAYAIGIASTLSESLGLPPVIWVFTLLAVVLLFLRRDSLDATVASALVIGACSIGLIMLLSLLAVLHLDSSNLGHSEIPFVDGKAFDAGVLETIFGVTLLALFGHTSTANCAAVVLERDPSARALIRGCAAAIATATLLYVLWIAAVNGAIAPERLIAEQGTALSPLAEIAGPAVDVVGGLFVVLAMGMASVHYSWGLRNMAKEVLSPAVTPNAQARMRMSPHTATRASLAPIVAIMVVVAVLFAIDRESFSGPLGFLGVITAPLVAGIFSMMMLVAARRKGDCAVGYRWRFLGNPFMVVSICITFLSAILVHGLFIWTDPLQRVSSVIVSVVTVLFVIAAMRTSFIKRETVEVRYSLNDRDQMPKIAVIANGDLVTGTTMYALDPDSDRAQRSFAGVTRTAVKISLPPAPVGELMVWVHQVSPEGDSIPVPATLEIDGGQSLQLDETTGRVLLPVTGQAQHLIVRPQVETIREVG